MKLFVFLFVIIFLLSCETPNNKLNSKSENKEDKLTKKVKMYPSGNKKTIYYVDSSGLRQGDFTHFFDNGNTKSEGYYFNDTLTGFIAFYDTTGVVIEKESKVNIDKTLMLSEFIEYVSGENGKVYPTGSFFQSQFTTVSNNYYLDFYSYYSRVGYDSLQVEVIGYDNDYEIITKKEYKILRDTFKVKLDEIESVSHYSIDMTGHTHVPNEGIYTRELHRTYPVQNGEPLMSIWNIYRD